MNVALFFTYNMSINDWDNYKILDREVKYYEKLSIEYGINFTFVTYGDKNDLKYSEKFKNISILPMYQSRKKPNNKMIRFFSSLILPFRIKNKLVEVDIFKTNQLMGVWIPIILKLITSKKLIVRTGYNILDFAIKEKKGIIKICLYYLLTQISLWSSDKFIVTSEQDIKFFNKAFIFHKNKLIKINNWINQKNDIPSKENRKNQKILMVGRLENQKNYKNLIKNLKDSKIEIDIVGDGSLKESLQKLSNNLNVDVNFIGKLSHEQLIKKYSEYKYYLIFSIFEGHPKSLIEAMSRGCIPIVLRAAYTNEVIEDGFNGIVIKNETESVENIIFKLNKDNEKANYLSRNASNFALENYSISKVLDQEFKVYESLRT